MKATTLLREQHRRLDSLLARVESEHGQVRLATMLAARRRSALP